MKSKVLQVAPADFARAKNEKAKKRSFSSPAKLHIRKRPPKNSHQILIDNFSKCTWEYAKPLTVAQKTTRQIKKSKREIYIPDEVKYAY